jgi:DNA-binding YbaB/EbfC family protein
MFGNLFGGMEEKQEAMRQTLALATVTGKADGITVTANGNREIMNIQIDPAILTDKEQLEDLLVVALNRALKAALELEGEAAQKLLQESLGSLGGLSSLFS